VDKSLRVAFFPDSYLEVNGAAMTCRRLADYAARQDFPFLCVHAGPKTELKTEGSVTHLALKRSPMSFLLDEDLAYDPLFQRHTSRVLREIREFQPDAIHITGVNDVSIIGAFLAWKLQLPLLGSWHTNVHEFAASRLEGILRFLPSGANRKIASAAESVIMKGALLYYKMPKVILSPNEELVELLGRGTNRVSRLMGRGVDTDFFDPSKRTAEDGVFRFGFVGRLRAEKHVRMLADVEKALLEAGRTGFEFLIVGEGTEREYLEQNMKTARLTGFLEGEPLAEAYANMDVFIFPSETDAFGNVAQEANASGVPSIVSAKGGPKFLIRHGETGYVASEPEDYAKFAMELLDDRNKLAKMKLAARKKAKSHSWDAIFEGVYDGYREAMVLEEKAKLKQAAKKAKKKNV
jgi:phosphatidylinositol alpha 1,6-mannosyltransferase